MDPSMDTYHNLVTYRLPVGGGEQGTSCNVNGTKYGR